MCLEGKTRIVFTGDIAFSRYFQNGWKDNGCLDVDVQSFLKESDYVVANLESPLTDKSIISERRLNHASNPKAGQYLSNLNIKIWNLANNHIMDCGVDGLKDTLEVARENDCKTLGAGYDLDEAMQPIILGETVKIGVLSIVSAIWEHLTLEEDTFCAATWDKTKYIKSVIDDLRNRVDWIVLLVHGGDEYCDIALPYIKEKYHEFLNLGVDIIVGHHPHVIQNYERVGKKMIFYSIGNFIFDTENQRDFAHTDNGILLGINFGKDTYSFDCLPIHIDRDRHIVLNGELPPVFREINQDDYPILWHLEAKMFYLIDLQNRKKSSARLKNANRVVFLGHEILACRHKRERVIQKGRILSHFDRRDKLSLTNEYEYLAESLRRGVKNRY